MSSNSHQNTQRLARRLRRHHYRQMAAESPVGSEANHHHHNLGVHRHPADAGHQKELKQHQELAAKLQDQILRTQAEFENFRKRARREAQQQIEAANKELLTNLLPVLDNFERAVANPGSSIEALLNGIEMVHKQFIDQLAQHGLEKIEAQGQPFDPNLHEAVATTSPDGVPENHVVEVLQDGYQLKGRLLRPAMVRVAKG